MKKLLQFIWGLIYLTAGSCLTSAEIQTFITTTHTFWDAVFCILIICILVYIVIYGIVYIHEVLTCDSDNLT